MKLSERFESFTPIELKRAVEMREREIIKTESEIRVLRGMLRKKTAALANLNATPLQGGPTSKKTEIGNTIREELNRG